MLDPGLLIAVVMMPLRSHELVLIPLEELNGVAAHSNAYTHAQHPLAVPGACFVLQPEWPRIYIPLKLMVVTLRCKSRERAWTRTSGRSRCDVKFCSDKPDHLSWPALSHAQGALNPALQVAHPRTAMLCRPACAMQLTVAVTCSKSPSSNHPGECGLLIPSCC